MSSDNNDTRAELDATEAEHERRRREDQAWQLENERNPIVGIWIDEKRASIAVQRRDEPLRRRAESCSGRSRHAFDEAWNNDATAAETATADRFITSPAPTPGPRTR
ncbi:hypothetical protein ACIGO9_29700 [Nocardia asteroides]|uniref:hypothetical protein n=1 Tax=Nocardia asteroides TaxID=1824 RepID=UPI0037C8243D